MTIHLYAEHLINIRSLSLQASLSTVSNKETRATLSADGSTLTLAHEGEVATIKLPIAVPGTHNNATLTIPAAPTKDLSFRISLSEKPGAGGLLTSGNFEDTNVVPWTAPSLTPETELACRNCQEILAERGKIKVWKDLPSENWAEMMDFWHCHRPDVPRDDDHSAPSRGYSAGSRLALELGVGMVDPVDFILAAEDCQNVEVGAYHASSVAYPFSFNMQPHGQKEPDTSRPQGRSLRKFSGYKCPTSNRQSVKLVLALVVGLAERGCHCLAFHCRFLEPMDSVGFKLDTNQFLYCT